MLNFVFDLQNCLSQVPWNMLRYRRLHLKNMEESQITSLETCHLLGHKVELFFFVAWYGWWEVTHQVRQDSFCGSEPSVQHRKGCLWAEPPISYIHPKTSAPWIYCIEKEEAANGTGILMDSSRMRWCLLCMDHCNGPYCGKGWERTCFPLKVLEGGKKP